MGLGPSGYMNLLYYVYSFIPTDCGGYDTSDAPISPENLLRILMYTGTQTQKPYQTYHNPFQAYQNNHQQQNPFQQQSLYQQPNVFQPQNPFSNGLGSIFKTDRNE